MFEGLRHDPVVSSNHEQGHIKACGAGEHVANETFMARDIDDRNSGLLNWALELGKAEIDGDSALFFGRQLVRIDACEGFDQRGFPMIDMPGRAEDQRLVWCCHLIFSLVLRRLLLMTISYSKNRSRILGIVVLPDEKRPHEFGLESFRKLFLFESLAL